MGEKKKTSKRVELGPGVSIDNIRVNDVIVYHDRPELVHGRCRSNSFLETTHRERPGDSIVRTLSQLYNEETGEFSKRNHSNEIRPGDDGYDTWDKQLREAGL